VTIHCPQCQAAVEVEEPTQPTRVKCGECGATLKVRPRAEETDEEEAEPSRALRAVMFVGEWFPGLLRPLVLVMSLIVCLVGLGAIGFGIALFAAGVLISSLAVSTAGVVIYAHGASWLLDGDICWLSDSLTNFDGRRWGIFFLLLAVPFVAIFFLVRLLLAP
jgi:hypothetical protein